MDQNPQMIQGLSARSVGATGDSQAGSFEQGSKGWDLVGDIHGQHGKLVNLLGALGYEKKGGCHRHPERRAVFLGDLIDRGPDVRGVLTTVRAMVDEGEAIAIMGNHELNAIHYHTRDPEGKPLRSHSQRRTLQHSATLEQFRGRDGEFREWLDWFRRLPFSAETDTFRAIHACWSPSHLEEVRGRSLADDSFVLATGRRNSPEGRALDTLLKGPELKLPHGSKFSDKDGHGRDAIRIRWWNLGKGGAYRELVMPPGAEAPDGEPDWAELRGVPDYPTGDKTVFFGHYWLEPGGGIAPLADNVMCLDYGAGKNGPLVACRWGGSLGSSEFFSAH